ncbi:MAG: hypothetical protein U0325_06120 [Polyangiales bacterium]
MEVDAEVALAAEPLRVDEVITLRAGHARDARDEGQSLRGLWRHLRAVMLVEFKSRARAFRQGDLHRLLAYGHLWCAERKTPPADVTLALVVPGINDALRGELAAAGLTLALRDDGYHEVAGMPSRLVVAELRVIAAREGDDALRWLASTGAAYAGRAPMDPQHVHTGSDDMSMQIDEDLEGFYQYAKELMKKLPLEERLEDLAPEQRLAGLAPEQRLAGLAPEQRLAGLSEADRVLALPDAALRALPADYLATLPADAQARIRARLGR